MELILALIVAAVLVVVIVFIGMGVMSANCACDTYKKSLANSPCLFIVGILTIGFVSALLINL